MSKKVLVIYYSQSGQLADIVDNFTKPLLASGATVEVVRIKPQNDYEFPWTSDRFFDTMPESVFAKPVPLQPIQLKESKYDLIVFGYQPWFLSLSIPANSAILHPAIQAVLKDTPVLTIIAARNMWLNAQEKLKVVLKQAEAKLVGNIALVDRHHNLVSVVTILYWMMTGKRDKYLGVFPKPGVSDKDIQHVSVFGETVAQHLRSGDFTNLQRELVNEKAVEIKPDLLFVEERAGRLFMIWANLVTKRNNRTLWLRIYKWYLLVALFLVAPIVLAINALLFRPFFTKSINRKKLYYSGLVDKI